METGWLEAVTKRSGVVAPFDVVAVDAADHLDKYGVCGGMKREIDETSSSGQRMSKESEAIDIPQASYCDLFLTSIDTESDSTLTLSEGYTANRSLLIYQRIKNQQQSP